MIKKIILAVIFLNSYFCWATEKLLRKIEYPEISKIIHIARLITKNKEAYFATFANSDSFTEIYFHGAHCKTLSAVCYKRYKKDRSLKTFCADEECFDILKSYFIDFHKRN